MPCTLCHPAVVLPLHGAARRRTQLSALVIGSLAGVLYRPAARLERGLFNAVVTGMATAALVLLLLAAGRRFARAWAAKRRA